MDGEHGNKDAATLYAESVEREREAWMDLQAHAPGSPQRAHAWQAWSDAILDTNRAWRRLSASRVGMPPQQRTPTRAPGHAGA